MRIGQMRKVLLGEFDRFLTEVERVESRLGKCLRHVGSVPAFATADVQHRAAAL